jgi:hypothetical protein
LAHVNSICMGHGTGIVTCLREQKPWLLALAAAISQWSQSGYHVTAAARRHE